MNNLNNKIYSNNNNLLLGIVNDLQQIINNTHDNLIIKRIGDIINKMNFIINDNKKNTQLIINHISSLENKIMNGLNKKFDQLNINNNQLNNQIVNYPNGERYVGQIINGLREYYYNNGNRYEGDWRNGKAEGKGIAYYNDGARYEGDFRNSKREGKGIIYYNDGDREMGDYLNNKPIGKHVMLTKNGEVKTSYY